MDDDPCRHPLSRRPEVGAAHGGAAHGGAGHGGAGHGGAGHVDVEGARP